ncbi:MAG: epoxyqueuosine reductase QueH [Candidatus Omnitrophota bacterium]
MKALLHVCCGVCASSVVERLKCDGFEVTCYFYNPNIHPVDEYRKRLEAARKVAEEWGVEFIEGPYDRENWFLAVKGKEYAPEGGARCDICFEMRLKKTYEYLRKKMFDRFTTTLTVSPHKDVANVNRIGREIDETRFICADFKKKGGYERTMELAREWGLYKQCYCGCVYSLEEKYKREDKAARDKKRQGQGSSSKA